MATIRKPILLGMIICTLLQLSPVSIHVYKFSGNTWSSTSYPVDTQIMPPLTRADLDGDGQLDILVHENNQTNIVSNGLVVWKSPSDWQVIQALISDLNLDGKHEVTLLIRRPFRPWPVDRWLPYGGRISDFQDSSGQGCHIILIGWMDGRYKEIWAGSSMSQPALAIGAADFNQDGRVEMVTLEGAYNDTNSSTGNAIKLWEWNGFGFSLLSTLTGEFDNFKIIQSPTNQNTTLILVH